MGWGIAGGLLGILLMIGAYRWLVGWSTARAGGFSVPMIGSRPRRLAGVPEEAPMDAKMPPAMVVLRHAGNPLVVDVEDSEAASVQSTVAERAQPVPVVKETAVEDEVEVVAVGTSSGVEIIAINQGSGEQGEHVVISNNGPNPVALEGWRLVDEGEKHEYHFQGVILAPAATLRVHMWRGEDTETDVYVGRRNRWWNNDGNTAHLYDAAGVLVHSMAIEAEEA